MLYAKYFLLLLSVFLFSCGGLEPIPKTILSGEVVFIHGIDKWPPKDSLFDMRVVALKTYPPKNLITEIMGGEAYFTEDSLGFFVDKTNFTLEIEDAPVELKYIAVAYQYGDIFQWKVIGVYTLTNDNTNPSSIKIEEMQQYDIKIYVDFDNLPPQPEGM